MRFSQAGVNDMMLKGEDDAPYGGVCLLQTFGFVSSVAGMLTHIKSSDCRENRSTSPFRTLSSTCQRLAERND
jgi:hypothetical protein